MKRIYFVLAVWLLLAVVSAGCGGSKGLSAAEKAVATAEKAAATAQKAAAQAAQQAVVTKVAEVAEKPAAAIATKLAPAAATKPAPTAGAGETFSVQSRDAGLDKLKTYRARWRSEWKSTEGSVTESVIWEWFEEVARDSKSHHWGSKTTDAQTKKLTEIGFWQIADELYVVTTDDAGKQECMMISGDAQKDALASGLLSPTAFGGVNDAKYVGAETVNGIKTKHYKYDEKAATLAAFGRVSGEIWVAEDGGYVVKDTINWQGAAGMFGAGAKTTGAGTWTFEVLDINKPLTIEPPEICKKDQVDVPVMPNALEKSRIGPLVTYTTSAKPADVVEFYKKEMAKAGWQLDGVPEISDAVSMLNFTKAGATAQITIMLADGKSQVMINTTKE
ncbi:MAG: hypothetical protein QG637_1702 [Chloroflexota bacterium]|nr:hypothetical protein [Chloroflexota bacterium]